MTDAMEQARARIAEQVERFERARAEGGSSLAAGATLGELGRLYHGHGFEEAAAVCYRRAAVLQRSLLRDRCERGDSDHLSVDVRDRRRLTIRTVRDQPVAESSGQHRRVQHRRRDGDVSDIGRME